MNEPNNVLKNLEDTPFITGERRHTEGNNAAIKEVFKTNVNGDEPAEIKKGWLLKTYNKPRKKAEKILKHPFAEEVKKHIQSIEKALKDFLPEHQLVISKGEEGNMAHVAIEEVYQSELKEKDRREMARQMDEFIEKALQTYFNTFSKKSGTGMVADLEPASVIFGTTISNGKPKLYFIDFFPLTERKPRELESDIALLTKSLTREYFFPKVAEALKKLRTLNES